MLIDATRSNKMEPERKQELFLVSEHPEVFGPLAQALSH